MQIPHYTTIYVFKNKTQNINDPSFISQLYGCIMFWVTVELKRVKVIFSKF